MPHLALPPAAPLSRRHFSRHLLASLPALSFLPAAENSPPPLPDGLYSEITTERGTIIAELFYKKTPLTVTNHVGLAEGTLGPNPGKPFYNGLTWCRVVPGLVVQGGDPTGTGNGDAGYLFPDEIVPGLRHDAIGTLQMGNDGPDTNGSQFCLMLSAQHRLNYEHSVFGKVVRGLDLLPLIRQGDTMKVRILRIGPAAAAFKADKTSFAALQSSAKRYSGPRDPGPDAPFHDPDSLLPAEWERARHFNFKLTNFTRFTGLHLAARLFKVRPEAARGPQLASWLQSEASRLGTSSKGALAVYFQQENQWHFLIGSASLPSFTTTNPLGLPLKSPLSTEDALAAFLADATSRADTTIATATSRLAPGESMTAARRLKLLADAVLDGLIFKLEAALP